jgi:hypothetical protein
VIGAAEKDDAKIAAELQQILEMGLVQRADLKRVDRRIEQAVVRYSDAPCLHFAHGLILQDRLLRKEAAEEFATAVRLDRSCGPAWRSLIQFRLTEKEPDRLCDDLVEFAEALAKSRLDWRATERHELAVWLGRVHGFLLLDEVQIVSREALNHNLAIVHRRLPQVLHSDYEAGLQKLSTDYDKLLTDIELEIAGDESKTARKTADKLTELKERRQEIKRKSNTAALTKEQWESWLKEQLTTTGKRLEELKQDYEKLEAADRKLISLDLQTELDRQRLRTEYGLQGIAGADIDRQPGVLRMEQERLRYANERLSLQQQAVRVKSAARANIVARADAIRRYEQATGDIREEDATLTRWQQAINRSTLKVKEKAASTASRKRLLRKLSLPTTYFEVDEKVEAQRLLRQFGTTLAGQSN